MNTLINLCLQRSRTVLSVLGFILVAGTVAFINIPKEAEPDIKIPIMIISVHHRGIAPNDAERLILKPLEQKLRTVEGLKEMRASAYEGGAQIVMEFFAGFDAAKARSDIRDQLDLAKPDLPEDTKDPVVKEINIGHLPVILIRLVGTIPQRTLYKVARDLKEEIESKVVEVLKAELVGDREEVIEILLEPKEVEQQNLSLAEIAKYFASNNLVVGSGLLKVGDGQMAVAVPGLIKDEAGLANLPAKANGNNVLKIGDIGKVRRTFKDPEGFARDSGVNAVMIEVSKRSGQNIIETVAKVYKVVEAFKSKVPAHLQIDYAQDKSVQIKDMLADLENNVIAAVILVMMVVVLALGARSAMLVGIAVPGSFLAGIFVLSLMGLTLNVVVLFSLILSVGMLVDGAIIVVEYADRKMSEGFSSSEAYSTAALRMAGPVFSSIITIIVVFLPLLFWPGVVGQFMKFLPITLIATLGASLVMALIFVPTLGMLFGKPSTDETHHATILATESGNLMGLDGLTGWYVRTLSLALNRPKTILWGCLGLLITVIFVYKVFGRGVEFFPSVEPDIAHVKIHARGNLSIYDKDKLVSQVEASLLGMKEFSSIYTRVGEGQSADREDMVGHITVEFVNWQKRRKADQILFDVKEKTKHIPGIDIEVSKEAGGPQKGKPIDIEVRAEDEVALRDGTREVRKLFESISGLVNIEDSRPLPQFEWCVDVDRSRAAQWGVDVAAVGDIVQMITSGRKLGAFRPNDVKEEMDIVIRFPEHKRSIDELRHLKVMAHSQRMVSASSLIKLTPSQKVSTIRRTDGRRVCNVRADLAPGVLAGEKLIELKARIAGLEKKPGLSFIFKGEDEEQAETGAFLAKAFGMAIFFVSIILVAQFNSFFSMFLVLSAVLMSTIGVFVGLLIHGMPFGIVMGGIGVIALAGVIVSNNIILIDTYDRLKLTIADKHEAILRTGAQRLRPVILTKLTAILGLLPIMFRINIDFAARQITYGAPSADWWVPLAVSIVYGLLFASSLTLFFTPCALMLHAQSGHSQVFARLQANLRELMGYTYAQTKKWLHR